MKRIKIAILISILLIGGIVFGTLWLNLQQRKAGEEKEEKPKVSEDGANMRMEKIRLVEDKHGRKTWELEAKSIQQYQDENIMLLQEVKVTFYGKDGRSFVLSGNEGKVYQNSKNIELKGNVVLNSSDGYWLKTQSVVYQHQAKKATSSDPVEINGEEIRLEGKGMEVDMEAQTFKILHQVKTRWKGGVKG
jgi:LPS export ABC transporter protein LptC